MGLHLIHIHHHRSHLIHIRHLDQLIQAAIHHHLIQVIHRHRVADHRVVEVVEEINSLINKIYVIVHYFFC